jgi:outer membrane receptor protein involved in Fe transport
MKQNYFLKFLLALVCLILTHMVQAQTTYKGIVMDAAINDPIIGATLIIKGTTTGTATDWDGTFALTTDKALPFTLEIAYLGYVTKEVEVTENKRLTINLQEDAVTIEAVEVKASRISDKQKESPLTIEALDNIAIKETPAADFYDGLGSLKGVDLTAASLGFKVVNTRGFNSTSPVRSLQIIDGVDNQAPGLNFSLGNFLGSSELDVNKVELVVGASSAFYGPNAFNGVISMETKDPFFHTGLSAMVKVGERNMLKGAIRWADVFQNKDGNDFIAYKLNFEALRADDWVADNFDPVDDSDVSASNPGRFDAVNIYGDEYFRGNDFSDLPLSDPVGLLGQWHRTGYEEEDLVDYGTRNYKANAAVHFRLNPALKEQSPELIIGSSYGSGTTVYQGDNRFSLRGITFLQNKIEFRKKNTYFLRAYTTRTGAGESYDPYFTALKLQENAKKNREWSIDYADYWQSDIVPLIIESDYPKLEVSIDPETGQLITNFDAQGARQWQIDNNGLLMQWHNDAAAYADAGPQSSSSQASPYFRPGTPEFKQEFDQITSTLRSDGGTRFFDNSALYHAHGEYVFKPLWIDRITIGSNARLYTPESRGTVFYDTTGTEITNFEFGVYGGLQKSLFDNRVKLQGAIRADKNQNFDWLISPAASIVYTPSANNFFRASFSSAIRNPTLSDQYLFLNVGRAILSGNLEGVSNLVTVESLGDFFATQMPSVLDSFNIAPVKPEKVKTFELGFRTTLFQKLYVDAGYYYSIYDSFLGFQIGVDLEYDNSSGPITVQRLQAYRYAANSQNQVTTQGFSIGLNYFLGTNYSLSGNYSWNRLNKNFPDDPIIPAFNTPEHKFNLGFGGRNLDLGDGRKNLGFNINYKWIEGFLFEGSPQFTGFIPTYDMLDAQVNYTFKKYDTTLKIGASNILDKQRFQTYGGPRIGRLAYITLTYEPK